MDIFKTLTREHHHILTGLVCLEKAKNALEENKQPPAVFFEESVLFFSQYADRLHHYKEEFLLFSILASKKEGTIDLEVGALRHQHELNRKLMGKIQNALKGYMAGSEIAVTTVLRNLSPYISVLRRHIYREDHLFFPMAEKELSEKDIKGLTSHFFLEEADNDAQRIRKENLSRLQKMEKLIAEVRC